MLNVELIMSKNTIEITGDQLDLVEFKHKIRSYFSKSWKIPDNNELIDYYIGAEYVGSSCPNATLYIFADDEEIIKNCRLRVGNIVPKDKSNLSDDEYSELIELFFNDVIKGYCNTHRGIKSKISLFK